MDPDDLALAAVQQYLEEHGWYSALRALEQESRQAYEADRLPQASTLLQMVHGQMLAQASEPSTAEERLRRDALSALDAAHPGPDAIPSRELAAWGRVHGGAGVTCVAALAPQRGREVILSCSVNGSVAWTDVCTGETLCLDQLASSGILCVAVHPTRPAVCALGCMDGGIVVVDGAPALAGGPPEVLARCVGAHRKYAVVLAWTGAGDALVSGAWDDSVALHAWDRAERMLHTLRRLPLRGHVTALARLGDRTFLAAVRGEPALLELRAEGSCAAGAADAAAATNAPAPASTTPAPASTTPAPCLAMDLVRVREHSLNEDPDDVHVSFSAMAAALSPDGRFLAVATDAGRVVILAPVGEQGAAWRPVRRIFGLSNADRFHIWSLAWVGGEGAGADGPAGAADADAREESSGRAPATPSSFSLAVAAPGGEVRVFSIATSGLLCTLCAHSPQAVRAIAACPGHRLVSASLDGSIKLFGP